MREEKWSMIITLTVLVLLALMAVKQLLAVPSYEDEDAVVEELASDGGNTDTQPKPKDFGDDCEAAKAHFETTDEESHCDVPDFPAGKIVFSKRSLSKLN